MLFFWKWFLSLQKKILSNFLKNAKFFNKFLSTLLHTFEES